MRETGKNQELDNLIIDEMRTAFGYGKDSLITEFDEAARQMDDSDRTPPEGEFEKILTKAALLNAEEKKSSKKLIRLRRVGKIGLLVAILGCVLLGTGIGASGKRYYEYTLRTSDNGKSSVWNNAEYIESELEVEDAYQVIKDKLGIEVLRLIYIPEGMQLSDLHFGVGYARMEFNCDDGYIYFVQSQHPVESLGGTISDCENLEGVHNKVLNKDLEIKRNILTNNINEYSTEFTINNTYYHLTAVIAQEEFNKILTKINRFEG